MLQLKLQFLAVALLVLLSHADGKPKCANVDNYWHPHECRKRCPIVGPHFGHENERYVDMVTDEGTCDEGLKCCQLYYYVGNYQRVYTNTGTSKPHEGVRWCEWFNVCS